MHNDMREDEFIISKFDPKSRVTIFRDGKMSGWR